VGGFERGLNDLPDRWRRAGAGPPAAALRTYPGVEENTTVGGEGESMDRRQVDTALPMVYGLAVVICALWVHGALIPVAVIGAILLGMYYAVLRTRMVVGEGGGRRRNRIRNR
jgi:hypothetical protein